MVVLFAAGNDGDDAGFSSLDKQAYLKNGITVGASMTTPQSMAAITSPSKPLIRSNNNAGVCKTEGEACMTFPESCRVLTVENCTTTCTSGCSENCWKSQFIDEPDNPFYVDNLEEDLAYFTSLGPTSDGRRKPEIVAPGYYIVSARANGPKCNAPPRCPTSVRPPDIGPTMAPTSAPLEPLSIRSPRLLASDIIVVMETDVTKDGVAMGPIMIAVHPDWAPVGAQRFLDLVRAGFFASAAFFRVVPTFVAQFGIAATPSANEAWGPIDDEPVIETNSFGRLTYAMTSEPNSRSHQLFFNLGNNDYVSFR